MLHNYITKILIAVRFNFDKVRLPAEGEAGEVASGQSVAKAGRQMSLLIGSTFSPEDLDILRHALDAWCAERRIDIKSSEAQIAASAALDLYQSGFDDSDKLLLALRDLKSL